MEKQHNPRVDLSKWQAVVRVPLDAASGLPLPTVCEPPQYVNPSTAQPFTPSALKRYCKRQDKAAAAAERAERRAAAEAAAAASRAAAAAAEAAPPPPVRLAEQFAGVAAALAEIETALRLQHRPQLFAGAPRPAATKQHAGGGRLPAVAPVAVVSAGGAEASLARCSPPLRTLTLAQLPGDTGAAAEPAAETATAAAGTEEAEGAAGAGAALRTVLLAPARRAADAPLSAAAARGGLQLQQLQQQLTLLTLDLSHNELATLPQGFGRASAVLGLTSLNLSRNWFKDLPHR